MKKYKGKILFLCILVIGGSLAFIYFRQDKVLSASAYSQVLDQLEAKKEKKEKEIAQHLSDSQRQIGSSKSMEEMCRQGNRVACTVLLSRNDLKEKKKRKNFDRYIQLFIRGCDEGEKRQCDYLSNFYLRRADIDNAINYARSACQEDPFSCDSLKKAIAGLQAEDQIGIMEEFCQSGVEEYDANFCYSYKQLLYKNGSVEKAVSLFFDECNRLDHFRFYEELKKIKASIRLNWDKFRSAQQQQEQMELALRNKELTTRQLLIYTVKLSCIRYVESIDKLGDVSKAFSFAAKICDEGGYSLCHYAGNYAEELEGIEARRYWWKKACDVDPVEFSHCCR